MSKGGRPARRQVSTVHCTEFAYFGRTGIKLATARSEKGIPHSDSRAGTISMKNRCRGYEYTKLRGGMGVRRSRVAMDFCVAQNRLECNPLAFPSASSAEGMRVDTEEVIINR